MVLSAGPTPHTPLEEWDFSIVGEVDEPKRWTWEEFRELPSEEITKNILHTLTRSQPPGWAGYSRRTDKKMLEEVAWSPKERPLTFVCGPTPLVEAVATALVGLGQNSALIKTERFGPTGE